jgi:hypothetical protein
MHSFRSYQRYTLFLVLKSSSLFLTQPLDPVHSEGAPSANSPEQAAVGEAASGAAGQVHRPQSQARDRGRSLEV